MDNLSPSFNRVRMVQAKRLTWFLLTLETFCTSLAWWMGSGPVPVNTVNSYIYRNMLDYNYCFGWFVLGIYVTATLLFAGFAIYYKERIVMLSAVSAAVTLGFPCHLWFVQSSWHIGLPIPTPVSSLCTLIIHAKSRQERPKRFVRCVAIWGSCLRLAWLINAVMFWHAIKMFYLD
jgi:hypothetical protein